MPRIDPETGCNVMTTGEFWASEAAREGKGREPGELMEDFANDMENDRKQCEDQYRDLTYTLGVLVEAVNRMNECIETPLPLPVEVIEVIEVNFGQGMRESGLFLRARARRADGVEDIIELQTWHDSGSRMEPPDGDENVTWENLDDEGQPITWKHLYSIGRKTAFEYEARKQKVEHLLQVIRKGGERVRINPEGELEYNAAREAAMYKALGRYLVHLEPRDGFWARPVR
jgi:hypothetical protein